MPAKETMSHIVGKFYFISGKIRLEDINRRRDLDLNKTTFPPHCGFSFSRKTVLHFKSGKSRTASCRRWSIQVSDGGRKEDERALGQTKAKKTFLHRLCYIMRYISLLTINLALDKSYMMTNFIAK